MILGTEQRSAYITSCAPKQIFHLHPNEDVLDLHQANRSRDRQEACHSPRVSPDERVTIWRSESLVKVSPVHFFCGSSQSATHTYAHMQSTSTGHGSHSKAGLLST